MGVALGDISRVGAAIVTVGLGGIVGLGESSATMTGVCGGNVENWRGVGVWGSAVGGGRLGIRLGNGAGLGWQAVQNSSKITKTVL